MCQSIIHIIHWIVWIFYLPGIHAVYFPQPVYEGVVQSSDEAGQGILRIYSVLNSTEDKDAPIYYIISSATGLSTAQDYNKVFGVNSSGWIYLKDAELFSNSQGANITLNVAAIAGRKDPKNFATARVELAIQDFLADHCSNACFQDTLSVIYVEENSGPQLLTRVEHNLRHSVCQHATFSYDITSVDIPSLDWNPDYDDLFQISNSSSELTLLTSLDRELWEEVYMTLSCLIEHPNGTEERKQRQVSVRVSDLDDSAPVMKRFNSSKQRDTIVWDYSNKKSLLILVNDNDTAGTDGYVISLRHNDKGWFQIPRTSTFQLPTKSRWKRTSILAVISVVDEKVKEVTGCTFEVVFNDSTYQKPSGLEFNSVAIAEVKLKLQVQETVEKTNHDHFIVEISRQAAKYTQVFSASRIPGLTSHDAHFFLDRDQSDIFKVTQKMGILYVEEPESLLSAKSTINITMSCYSKTSHLQKFLISVKLRSTKMQPAVPCDGSCSTIKFLDVCNRSCGVGAVSGRCAMRPDPKGGLSSRYSTCSPNLATCPDSICDELEKVNDLLCPQDCAETVWGSVLKGKPNGVGISAASGVCWCDTPDACQCWARETLHLNPPPSNTLNANPASNDSDVTTTTLGPPLSDPTTEAETPSSGFISEAKSVAGTVELAPSKVACGPVCQALTALGFVAFTVIIVICVSVWCVRRRRKRRTDELRHVGSNVSMNAIPSDYVEERRNSHNSIEWSPKTINNHNVYDQKWEFPRRHLLLGKSLGEGEFGVVVKARAYHITPKQEFIDVAVKMLKNCSNESEYQDLLSEFNLLKDVTHPNVVKLLGACTHEEPLYIIVEYCEHGSLRHYLRTYRHNNSLYLEANGAIPEENTQPPVQFNLSTRELLSFAWQIAKGMHYLADMKVVHRDLAARNVLVASGKVAKISDFGLSRDVYEADAYMKKSKGRIPVKWMAPESLYDQVYTTKSDVWSYGIVLWEIVTLGATPYPGIPPERLFGLLSTGYRMDRPDNCSEELYAVMQKCWKAEPPRRPHFIDLVNIFDSMLQAKMEYLDLNGALRTTYEVDYDSRDDGLTSGSPAHIWSPASTEPAYGSISVVKTDTSLYLTPTSKTAEQIHSKDMTTRGKTFPQKPSLLKVINPSDTRRVKLEVDLESDDDVFEAKETDSLRCTKV